MGLYKRKGKDGTNWCIQYFVHGKRVREAVGPSKRQAELVFAKRKADIREGRYFAPTEKPLIFSVLAERYLKEYAALHKKPRSYQRNVSSTKVLRAYFGEKLLTNIAPTDVHSFIVRRKDQGKTGATINAEINHLAHIFTWGNKLKLTTHHPVKGIARLKANQKERYLSREEISVLFSATSGDVYDMIVVALGTGMRATEVLSLDREHVNLKQGVAILPDTKNGERRAVPLPSEVIETLQCRPAPLQRYFPDWNLYKLTRAMREAADGVGMLDVTFHTLRHTFASYAVMSGVDLHTLAKILGLRDLSMVQRYAHLAPSHLQAATAQAATAIFAGNVPPQVPHREPQVA
jgi:integrase